MAEQDYNDDVDTLRQSSVGMADETGDMKMQSATSNVKLPLSMLPEEVKSGDTVEVTIVGIDKAKGCAYLDVTGKNPVTITGSAPTDEGTTDTSSLMGPLDKVRDMLKKASMDTNSQDNNDAMASPGPDQL